MSEHDSAYMSEQTAYVHICLGTMYASLCMLLHAYMKRIPASEASAPVPGPAAAAGAVGAGLPNRVPGWALQSLVLHDSTVDITEGPLAHRIVQEFRARQVPKLGACSCNLKRSTSVTKVDVLQYLRKGQRRNKASCIIPSIP